MLNNDDIPKRIWERRRSVRIDEAVPFKIGLYEGEDVDAETVNISDHGAMCLISHDIPIMTVLNVEVYLPPSGKTFPRARRVSFRGIVVRKDKDQFRGKFSVAIFFSNMKPKEEEVLRRFIEARLKLSPR